MPLASKQKTCPSILSSIRCRIPQVFAAIPAAAGARRRGIPGGERLAAGGRPGERPGWCSVPGGARWVNWEN